LPRSEPLNRGRIALAVAVCLGALAGPWAAPAARASGTNTPALVIGSGARMLLKPSTRLTLDCDLRNFGTFTPAAGSRVVVNGFGTPSLRGVSQFADLQMAMHGTTSLSNSASVTGQLMLTSGRLSLAGHDLVAPAVSGGSATSYVATPDTLGRLVRPVGTADAVTFPVGNASYNPVTARRTSGQGNLRVAVMDDAAATGLAPNAHLARAWAISAPDGAPATGPLVLTLQWNNGEQGPGFQRTFDAAGQKAWRWGGAAWAAQSGILTGDNFQYPAVVALTGASQGLWTLGSASYVSGVETALLPTSLQMAPVWPKPRARRRHRALRDAAPRPREGQPLLRARRARGRPFRRRRRRRLALHAGRFAPHRQRRVLPAPRSGWQGRLQESDGGALKKLLACAALLLAANLAHAQGVGINATGAPADTSAILDLSSTSKGLLVPRLTSAQRAAIALPATGLVVFQTDGAQGLYWNAGTPASPSWKQVGEAGAGGGGQWTASGSNIYYSAGKVAVGTTPTQFRFTVQDTGSVFRVQSNNTTGLMASLGGYGQVQVDAPGVAGGRLALLGNGNLGLGVANPTNKLSFAPVLGKKISLYPGATGDVGFGVAANRLQIYADNPNADVAIGYDSAGVFNERFAFKPNGALAVNGEHGRGGAGAAERRQRRGGGLGQPGKAVLRRVHTDVGPGFRNVGVHPGPGDDGNDQHSHDGPGLRHHSRLHHGVFRLRLRWRRFQYHA
jgi:hypothetical protein